VRCRAPFLVGVSQLICPPRAMLCAWGGAINASVAFKTVTVGQLSEELRLLMLHSGAAARLAASSAPAAPRGLHLVVEHGAVDQRVAAGLQRQWKGNTKCVKSGSSRKAEEGRQRHRDKRLVAAAVPGPTFPNWQRLELPAHTQRLGA
jgi:hypothetical protein